MKGFEKMLSAKVCIMLAIAIYLIAMLAIGIYCSKKNKNVDDFYRQKAWSLCNGYECRSL